MVNQPYNWISRLATVFPCVGGFVHLKFADIQIRFKNYTPIFTIHWICIFRNELMVYQNTLFAPKFRRSIWYLPTILNVEFSELADDAKMSVLKWMPLFGWVEIDEIIKNTNKTFPGRDGRGCNTPIIHSDKNLVNCFVVGQKNRAQVCINRIRTGSVEIDEIMKNK